MSSSIIANKQLGYEKRDGSPHLSDAGTTTDANLGAAHVRG